MPPTDRDPSAHGQSRAQRRMRFEAAGALVSGQVRAVAESRGFAVARVLTDWAELAGPELAGMCRPLRVSYAAKGFGATLVVETASAAAPLVAMRLDALRARINAAYGYAAIARIQLVQGPGLSPPPGMAEGPAAFAHATRTDGLAPPSPAALARARAVVGALTEGVSDPGLREALERLAINVLGRSSPTVARPAPDGKETA